MAQPVRFAMLEAATFDSGLTAAARVLYMAIHVRGRDTGVWEVSREQMARELHVTEREVRRRLAELRIGGYVRPERGKVVLEWAFAQDVYGRLKSPEAAITVRLNRPYRSASEPRIKSIGTQVLQDVRAFTRCLCGIPHDGANHRRCDCGRVHSPEQAEPEAALAAVVDLLHGYVAACGLPWDPPDAAIAEAVLEAAGGVASLWARLRGLMADRARPRQNYAWFVAVAGRRKAASA